MTKVFELSLVFSYMTRFSGWSIDKFFFEFIIQHFPKGSTMVELGSGRVTQEFLKYFKVYSIEHNPEWVGKFHDNYIYAPIKDYGNYAWYDRDAIKNNLPDNYDFVLIDGPPKKFGRIGFFYNLDLFNTNVPLLFDDTHRRTEKKLLKKVAKDINKPYKTYRRRILGGFGVINKEMISK